MFYSETKPMEWLQITSKFIWKCLRHFYWRKGRWRNTISSL